MVGAPGARTRSRSRTALADRTRPGTERFVGGRDHQKGILRHAPPELADAVLAPRHLNVNLASISPDKVWFVDEIGDGPVLMKTFAKPFHELGGVFIDHTANRSRALTIRNNVGIQLVSATDGSRRPIQVPAGTRISNATWAPDGKTLAFFVHGEEATHIYVADVATGKSRLLSKTPVLATMVSSFAFTDSGRQIVAVVVPDGRTAMPPPPAAPTGPTVKLAGDDKNRLRTFASLMSTAHEKDLLKWHAPGRLRSSTCRRAPFARSARRT